MNKTIKIILVVVVIFIIIAGVWFYTNRKTQDFQNGNNSIYEQGSEDNNEQINSDQVNSKVVNPDSPEEVRPPTEGGSIYLLQGAPESSELVNQPE